MHQVTLLEGRDKCEMKLTKPLKFRTGRRDCKTEEDRKYATQEDEVFRRQVLTLLSSSVSSQYMGRRKALG